MKAVHSLGQALSASVEKVLAPLLLQAPSKALSMWLLKAFLESQRSVYSSLIACLSQASQPQASKPLQVLQAAHQHLEELESLLKEKSRLKSRRPATPETCEQVLRLSRRILDCLITDSQNYASFFAGNKPAGADTLADALSRNTLFEDGTETLDSEQNKAAFRQHLLKIDAQLTNNHSNRSPQQSPSFKEDLSRQMPFSSPPAERPRTELASSQLQERTLERPGGHVPAKYFLPAKDLTFNFQSQLTTKTASLPQISLFNDSPPKTATSQDADSGLYRRFKLCFVLDLLAASRLRHLYSEHRRTKKQRIELLENELAKERVVNFKLLEALKNIGLSTDQVISQTIAAKDKHRLQPASKHQPAFARAAKTVDPEEALRLLHSHFDREATRPVPEIRDLSFQEPLSHPKELPRPVCVSYRESDAVSGRLTDLGIHRTFSARNVEEQTRYFQPFLRTSDEKQPAATSIASLRRLQEVSTHFPNTLKGWAGRIELPASAGLLQKKPAVHKRHLQTDSETDSHILEPGSGSPKIVAKRLSAADPQKPLLSASSAKTLALGDGQDKNSLFLQGKIKKSKTGSSQAKRNFANSNQSPSKPQKSLKSKGQMSQLQQFFDKKKQSEDKDRQKPPRPG